MAHRVFLHVGTMKSGTTYLQALWWHHRHELARRGLLVPGRKKYDHRFAAMVVRDGADVAAQRLNTRQSATWEQILAETAATDQDVVISNEIFSAVDTGPAQETVRRLGAVAEEVHVVLTARDLARILPSAWQQRVKKGRDTSFEEFLEEVRSEGPDGTFHLRYDVPDILDRWTSDLPAERVHVVVHPRRGAAREWLWHRLCQLTGMDPTGLTTDIAVLNQSLGLAEVEVLRALNAGLRSLSAEDRGVDTALYLKQGLVNERLLPAGGERFVATPEARAWAIERGRTMVDRLRARGWHVVGELDDLIPEPEQSGRRTPGDVTSAEVAHVALDSLVHELVRGSTQQQQISELREEVRRLRNRTRP
jgi:hypothetical protein